MALAARTRWTLERYWTDRLGVASDAFEGVGTSVGRADEPGVQLLCRDDALVAGAPRSLFEAVEQVDPPSPISALEGNRGNERTESDEISAWLASLGGIDRVLGPTFYGYTDRESFEPADGDGRTLQADDESAFEALRTAVPDDEFEQGGPAFVPGETVGLFVDGTLVAVSGYDVWDGLLAHLAVVTHPDYRNEGCGRTVVSRATERALADGFVPQYRTSEAWPWSVALARNLGFVRFATGYLGVPES